MGRCDGFHAEIRALQREGFRAIGFANPLRDLVGDSTYLAEFLRTLTGPIVLVGHSYGGNVISAAATGNDQVKALVYLNGWLGILGETLDGGDRKAVAKLADLRGELDVALTELRELVQGLDSPLLASDGLYAALSAAARRAGMRVTVDGKDVGRAPRSIESAVYFCCLEAIQNSAKHGGPGARASVRLTAQDGLLAFRVRDDGIGFDADLVRRGHGLINMSDRLDALGGHVEVRSVPGRGTIVLGQIPLP